MPNLIIKDVPEAWVKVLRQRSARNRRSLQDELLAMVELLINGNSGAFTTPDSAFTRSLAKSDKSGSLTIEDLYALSVARCPKPDTRGMLSVDMIRQQRNSR
jgi:plasmid stability protein